MAPSDVEVLAQAVTDLGVKIDGFRDEIKDQRVYAERTRDIVRRLNRFVVALVVIGVTVGIVAVVAIRTARVAQANSTRAVSQCEASNNARTVTLNTWNTVLSADFTSYLPPDQRQAAIERLAGLRANLAKVLVQQDCSKLK